MPTIEFTKEQFEAALPKHKTTKEILWKCIGFVEGEYMYDIPVKDGIVVRVKSSVGRSGSADSCGENSIRIWVVDTKTGRPLLHKEDAWTTRVTGWEVRMHDKIYKQYAKAKKLQRCPKCGSWMTTRKGKYGEFLGCTGFPKCKYTGKMPDAVQKPAQLRMDGI